MKFTDTPIKQKQLQFTKNEYTYHVKIIYSTAKFGFGYSNLSFYKAQLYKVNEERIMPIEYIYKQKNSKFLLSKKNSFQCTTRRKKIEGQENLYQAVKQKMISQYSNRFK